jgi:hypothetical protein
MKNYKLLRAKIINFDGFISGSTTNLCTNPVLLSIHITFNKLKTTDKISDLNKFFSFSSRSDKALFSLNHFAIKNKKPKCLLAYYHNS